METIENIGKKCLCCCNEMYLSLLFCLFMLCRAIVNASQIVFMYCSYENTAKWETCQIFKEDGLLVRV
jgi:hypothetical protein